MYIIFEVVEAAIVCGDGCTPCTPCNGATGTDKILVKARQNQ